MKTTLNHTLTISLIIICLQVSAFAQDKTETAEQAYNKGIDLYKKLEYNMAIDNFLKSFNTQNKKLEQWTNYNLGNSHFERASKAEQAKNPEASSEYQNALSFFQRAMELDPDDKDAKYNYEVTKLKLEELKQQQQKQQSSEKKQEKQQENEEKEQQQEQNGKDEKGQQKEQEQQSQQENAQDNKSDTQNQQKDKSQTSQAKPQEMTKEQAQMLLDNFRQSEDGLTQLRELEKNSQDMQVEKEW